MNESESKAAGWTKTFTLALAEGDDEDEDEELEPSPPSDALESFFERLAVPGALRTFLKRFSFTRNVGIGYLVFHRVSTLPKLERGGQASCLAEGLLAIGSCGNGDPLVVDLRNGLTVGYLFHDKLFEPDAPRPRACLVPTPFDVGAFFLAAAHHPWDEDAQFGFPSDAEAAERQAAFGWDEFAIDAAEPLAE